MPRRMALAPAYKVTRPTLSRRFFPLLRHRRLSEIAKLDEGKRLGPDPDQFGG
ncbi:hypothetical protein [Kosakonia sp. CCTCC M2018092]|uniref:hypothetical protein n=1 Tax=Kosakonia sp. CCTCC M2018092 TaxID=2492396 RepID=UPI0013DDB41D|nr:hypothetical protein [Kosakonia sp. CCTCC M2018092]